MSMPVLAVHDGSFHADDVFAVSILRQIYPDATVIRTRDPGKLAKADFRLDVGGRYDPSTGDFDHHQSEFKEARKNGIPYATAGLIWKEYGAKLSLDERQLGGIDEKLIQLIDANDSGFTLPWDKGELRPFTVSRIIEAFNPAWDEENADGDQAFHAACQVATQILVNEIKRARGKDKARAIVEDAMQKAAGRPYIILETGVPWQDLVVEKSEALFVIHPATNGKWRLRAVPVRAGGFELRKPLPASWAGKQDDELSAIAGVAGCIFCHKERFMAGTATREAAEQLAMKACGERD